MTFDPKPVSKGGDPMIDEFTSRNAPPGKFRVVSVGVFGGSRMLGDIRTLERAREYARRSGDSGTAVYVYNDRGENVYEYDVTIDLSSDVPEIDDLR